ncbi:hypothetical protein ATE84_1399 [Aquimarina sp. MAR_2010_214]|uniref:hypothetical protein n=1 Tax=Aquimarina sp. MAR_2010_214 TaxID=1250026 RepID=UPI000C6FF218|nr:hypothetical protein [Aquimarina sp. MAR_2010_214]PKV49377.1 hypothetical protein ATE84_1399 [Aquimarina sp. MAR_2010_214]
MKNELLITIMHVTIFIELLTAIIGTIYQKKYKKTKLNNFIYLIWYTAINELFTGIYLRRSLDIEEARILYNIFYLINFSYYFFLFKSYIVNKEYKKAINIFYSLYIISLVINGFYQNYLIQLQIIPYIIAACFLIITIIFYYIEILKSKKVLRIEKNLLFWISIGLLIHSIGQIPFRILRNYYVSLTDGFVSFLTTVTLTIIMNLCFIIGFIWSDKKQQY